MRSGNGFVVSEARCALIDAKRARRTRAERCEQGPGPGPHHAAGASLVPASPRRLDVGRARSMGVRDERGREGANRVWRQTLEL